MACVFWYKQNKIVYYSEQKWIGGSQGRLNIIDLIDTFDL